MINYAFIFLWGVAEWVRLYYGYLGNIRETFPELAAFLIITGVFSFPLLACLFLQLGTTYAIELAVQTP
jgi:hypothetical protein